MANAKHALSVLAALLLVPNTVSADTGGTVVCELTGKAVDAGSSVVVTDWVTNTKHTFHNLACAVLAMSADYPWSQGQFESSTGKTLRINNANGTWSSEPESATAAIIQLPSCVLELLAFTSYQDLSIYSRRHTDFSLSLIKTVPLSSLAEDPAVLCAVCQGTPLTAVQAGEARGGTQPLPPDVPPDHWAAEPVREAAKSGLMKGYPDGTFRGDQALTRYEMAVVVDRLAKKRAPDKPTAAATRPATPTEFRGGPTALADVPKGEQSAGGDVNFFGQSGLLIAPSARAVSQNTFAAGRAQLTDSSITYGSVGLGDDGRCQAGFAVTGGRLPSRILLNGAYRFSGSGPWDSKAAIGILDVTDEIDSSAYGVLSKTFSTRFLGGQRDIEVSGGFGTGSLLDGPFIGARTPLGSRGSFMAEYVQSFGGRSVDVGLGYRLFDDANVKVGFVDEELAGSLSAGGRF